MSPAPVDVANALALMETDALQALVREPLAAMGLSLPAAPPAPSSIMATLLAQLPPLPAPPGTTAKVGETKTEVPPRAREWKIG